MDEIWEMPGLVTVIQARMNSRRLPGKLLLPLGDATVLEQVIRRVQAARLPGSLVLALPEAEENRSLRSIAERYEIPIVMGSETDVLARMLQVARHYEASIVARCQANNPMLDPKMLWASARYAADSRMDYVTVARLPLGVASEAVSARTLERVAKLTDDFSFREQVTTFTDTRPDLFERANLPPPPRLARPDLRMTLETEADYWFLKRLYNEVAPGPDGLLRVDDCIDLIDSDAELSRHNAESFAVVRAAA